MHPIPVLKAEIAVEICINIAIVCSFWVSCMYSDLQDDILSVMTLKQATVNLNESQIEPLTLGSEFILTALRDCTFC